MLGYLGPNGTFSHQAAMEWSEGKEEIKEFSTIYSVILAVEKGEIDRAIVPIENSIDGSINTTLDTLAFDVDLYITGEYILHISENLMVKKGVKKENIKIITSHPQPIGQCSKLLSQEFADVKNEFADSTASAAKRVKESDGSVACIGSPNSAKIYDMIFLCPTATTQIIQLDLLLLKKRRIRQLQVTISHQSYLRLIINRAACTVRLSFWRSPELI